MPNMIGNFNNVKALPTAKHKDFVVQEMNGETLVYDLKNDKAHHLNESVAIVWKNCDGKTNPQELAQSLTKKYKTQIDEEFVWLAVDELNKANLLENKDQLPTFDRISRRKALFKYVLPAVMLPVVATLIAPISTHAQSSCIGNRQSGTGVDCRTDGVCCPGLCCVAGDVPFAVGDCVEPGTVGAC